MTGMDKDEDGRDNEDNTHTRITHMRLITTQLRGRGMMMTNTLALALSIA